MKIEDVVEQDNEIGPYVANYNNNFIEDEDIELMSKYTQEPNMQINEDVAFDNDPFSFKQAKVEDSIRSLAMNRKENYAITGTKNKLGVYKIGDEKRQLLDYKGDLILKASH